MTIQEAIKSGRKFKRESHSDSVNYYDSLHLYLGLTIDDILATDWEIEEEKIEISRSQLNDAFIKSKAATANQTSTLMLYEIAKHLGFKS